MYQNKNIKTHPNDDALFNRSKFAIVFERLLFKIKNDSKTKLVLLSLFVILLLVFLTNTGLIYRILNIEAGTRTVNFSGKIVNKIDGTNLIDGSPACVSAGSDTCDFRIRIYDASSGGNLLFEEDHENIEIGDTNGIFTLDINSICNSESSGNSDWGTTACISNGGVDFSSENIYIELSFAPAGAGSYTETFARKRLSNTGSAFYAERAGSLDTGFTEGSVVFQGATELEQDNANIFWDNTSKRLGLGTAVPSYRLDVAEEFTVAGTQSVAYIQAQRTSGTTGSLAGLTVDGINFVTGSTSTLVRGIIGRAYNAGGDGGTVTGVNGLGANTSSGVLTNAIGVQGGATNFNSGTITNGRSLHALNGSVGSGAITNMYGLYIEDITAGSTNYSIYANGSSPSYFGGAITNGALSGGGTRCVEVNNNGTLALASGACAEDLWTDGGTITYLTSTTDDLALGGTDSSSTFFFDVSANDFIIDGVSAFYLPNQSVSAGSLFIGGGGKSLDEFGLESTGVGINALLNGVDALANTAVGHAALYSTTDGAGNSALGNRALYSNTVGSNNIAVGENSLYENIDGSDNISIGSISLGRNTIGDSNVGIGIGSLYRNNTGNNNVALGYHAGYGSGGLSESFSNSVLLGYGAGESITTGGNNNLLIGYLAGNNVTTGVKNIVIGYDIDAPSATSTNTLNIGNLIYGTNVDGAGTTISTGNIGIGTTNPSSRLHVSLSTGTIPSYPVTPTAIFQNNSASTNRTWLSILAGNGTGATSEVVFSDQDHSFPGYIQYSHQFNSMNFGTDTTTKMVITSAGDVGIGNTTPLNNLDVGDSVLGDLNASQTVIALSDNNQNSLYALGQSTTARGRLGWSYNATEASAYMFLGNAATGHSLILQDQGGNVGIGTTTPLTMLHLQGTNPSTTRARVNTTGTGGNNIPGYEIYNEGTFEGGLFYNESSDRIEIYSSSGSTARIAIDQSGNVGIGTTTPQGKLEIAGIANTNGVHIEGSSSRNDALLTINGNADVGGSNDSTITKGLYVNVVTNFDAQNIVRFTDNGVVKFRVTGGVGNVYAPGIYNQSVSAGIRDVYVDNTGLVGYFSSSERFKKDIRTLNSVDWLYDLRPVNFTYKEDSLRVNHYGLIAEEVAKVNDYFVSYGENGQVDTVQYSFFISPLIKAVQDQKKEIDLLKLQVAANPQGTIPLSQSDLVLSGSLKVAGLVDFGENTVGLATVKAGKTEIEIKFTQKYSTPPVITITPEGQNYLDSGLSYSVVKKTVDSFTIKINKEHTDDIVFNWHAFE